jgi:hypothetical protein
MFRWLNGTRLGVAVVPDVWRMKAGASGSGSSWDAGRRDLGMSRGMEEEKSASMTGTPRCSAAVRAAEF